MRFAKVLLATSAMLASVPAFAQADAKSQDGTAADDTQADAKDQAFGLGQIIVTARRDPAVAIGSSTLSSEAIYTFNRNSLDEAVNLIPGVSASNSGGSRNERLIFVRGFDRFQVPLSIDGIRVYLPADNRLDYGRFLTPDIAEIQVAKGYASVLDGPGALGGAVNLVTRSPTKKLEVEARGTLSLNRDVGYAGYNAFGLIGTRQDQWYAQVSYTRNFQDHVDLPGGFTPTAIEDGGARDFSRTEDTRFNVKAGFTPNATDEYSISYTRQEGSKNAPLQVDPSTTANPIPARFWSWPYWNIDSIYFLSTTALGDKATLKTRIYRNTFDNLLRSFDTRTQTTQTLPRAFNSYYEDEAYGGSAQLEVALTATDTFRLAGHYRRDRHIEYQQVFPAGTTEPRQNSTEDTWSIAAENQLAITPQIDFVAGASYDWRDLKGAQDFTGTPGTPSALFISYPLRNAGAWNAQGRVSWRPQQGSDLYASISSRARFPTLFERFSSRFGGAVSNADLKAERATNFEIGGAHRFGVVRAEGAIFYSRLTDVIVAFPFVFSGQAVTQSRNLGSGSYYGAELSLSARLGRSLDLGGNYTYTQRDLNDPTNAAFQPTGVPTHKAFVYADWSPIQRLHIVPNFDITSDRWTSNTAGTRYFRTGSYVQANLRIDFTVLPGVDLGIGGRNLFDANYQLVDGFPEAGRSLFASIRARY